MDSSFLGFCWIGLLGATALASVFSFLTTVSGRTSFDAFGFSVLVFKEVGGSLVEIGCDAVGLGSGFGFMGTAARGSSLEEHPKAKTKGSARKNR